MKNKKLLIAGASTAAVGVIALGAFAYFNDNAVLDPQTATVGTVDVSVTGALNHEGGLNNLNPGDNDKDVPTTYRPGTDHELSFTVTNNGTKSVVTRTVIEVTGSKPGTTLTASDLLNVIISEKTTATALGDTSNPANRSSLGRLDPVGYVANENKLIYIIGGTNDVSDDVLDGTGANAENETINGESSKTSMVKTFDIGLDKDVSLEKFEGATINFNVKVEAMQYRNTGDAEWNTIFEHTYTAGSPSAN